jgi:hypothetical protein
MLSIICLHAGYYECIAVRQYTVRNIPDPVNRYLRKKAQLSGKSLNQLIIDELSEKVIAPTTTVGSALSWFIGSGIDDETLSALQEEDRIQKEIATQELPNASRH